MNNVMRGDKFKRLSSHDHIRGEKQIEDDSEQSQWQIIEILLQHNYWLPPVHHPYERYENFKFMDCLDKRSKINHHNQLKQITSPKIEISPGFKREIKQTLAIIFQYKVIIIRQKAEMRTPSPNSNQFGETSMKSTVLFGKNVRSTEIYWTFSSNSLPLTHSLLESRLTRMKRVKSRWTMNWCSIRSKYYLMWFMIHSKTID